MKSYFIFAIVLTVAYIVYYAVIIVHDLYGKNGAGKMQEEVFDLGEPDDEESVPYLSDGRTSEEMYRAMVAGGRMNGRPDMEWKPLKERL